ncbi:MAG: DegV family protein [Oscillospiraceae bacterium]|nr:DegV family protein [Oscillospiraceae bacterium]
MIRIVADSTCDLSKELTEKYNIQIAPLHIFLGEKEYLDGKEITPDEIYAWADANNDTPKTSAVGFEETGEIVKQLVGTEDEMIAFTISGKMSTTANVFRLVAEELNLQDRVSVIDAGNLSTGTSLLILKAADMAQAGKSRAEICQMVEEMKDKVQASFVVDTLTYLHRGGRCSSVAALAGGALKLHPKIVVADGSMSANKKYRGKMEKAIMDYVTDMEEELKTADRERVFVTHSGCEQEIIDSVCNYLKGLDRFDEILITRAGGVISSHCGPGTLGVLYIKE